MSNDNISAEMIDLLNIQEEIILITTNSEQPLIQNQEENDGLFDYLDQLHEEFIC